MNPRSLERRMSHHCESARPLVWEEKSGVTGWNGSGSVNEGFADSHVFRISCDANDNGMRRRSRANSWVRWSVGDFWLSVENGRAFERFHCYPMEKHGRASVHLPKVDEDFSDRWVLSCRAAIFESSKKGCELLETTGEMLKERSRIARDRWKCE
jgi:hypothetical protein